MTIQTLFGTKEQKSTKSKSIKFTVIKAVYETMTVKEGNHPTGDPTPSREDLEITRRLREAGDLLGVRVLDHIIVGETYTSFADRGML